MKKWITWDGRFHLLGDCNQHTLPESEDREHQIMPELCINPSQAGEGVMFVVPDTIDIAIIDLVERSGDIAVKIHLHNAFHVRGLMLRVYRGPECSAEQLVYQEILDRPGIMQLPDACLHSRAGLPPEPPMPQLIDQLNQPVETTPYTLRVWAANKPACFKSWTGALNWPDQHQPQVEPGRMVHNAGAEEHVHGIDGPWQSFFRRAGMKRGSPGPDRTRKPHHIVLAATAAPEQVKTTLKRAARDHTPFSDVLIRYSKPVVSDQIKGEPDA